MLLRILSLAKLFHWFRVLRGTDQLEVFTVFLAFCQTYIYFDALMYKVWTAFVIAVAFFLAEWCNGKQNYRDLPSFLLWSLGITATSKHLSRSLSLLWMAWADKQRNKQIWILLVTLKPWPNGIASGGKLKTWVYLQLRLARPCVHLRWLMLTFVARKST